MRSGVGLWSSAGDYMGAGDGEMFSASLWGDKVEFVDLSSVEASEPSSSTREMPLFVLGSPFYPMGNNFLNVFEMKYRTMMFDCANGDDRFGYIFSDPSGQIGKYGTVCKIVDRELLDDGRQYIAIQGESRFKVRRILKTLPYVVAEVDTGIEDDTMEVDEEKCQQLEKDVYNTLKYYVRLMREYPRTKKMMVTQAAKTHRPTDANISDRQRRSAFSFSLANMIQMGQPREGQLLLQTTSTEKRLEAEKMILTSAVDNVIEQLLKIDVISTDKQAELRFQSFQDAYDDDILPPDVIEMNEEKEDDEWTLQ